mmetsp:Transcript_33871/g.49586  ORF Transcript_33871/g.49586 Transcript_33871/m.49586 type:complete len:463 (+) Transcript_33871:27-1415(+)
MVAGDAVGTFVMKESSRHTEGGRRIAQRPHFFTKPWYKSGSIIEGKVPSRLYVNNRAVRARAGMLNITAVSVLALLFSGNDSSFIRRLAPVVLWEFVTSVAMGLTPLSPYGVVATLLTWKQPPIWKPVVPKRFAWLIGASMVSSCICFSYLEKIGLVKIVVVMCVTATFLECSLDFCCGCWLWNSFVAEILGMEACEECEIDFPVIAGSSRFLEKRFDDLASEEFKQEVPPEDAITKLIATHKVVIFSKSQCSPCVKAKVLLDSLRIKYHAVEVDKVRDPQAHAAALQGGFGVSSFPMIFINGKPIGNLDDLKRLHKGNKLLQLINWSSMAAPVRMSKSRSQSKISMLPVIYQGSPIEDNLPIGVEPAPHSTAPSTSKMIPAPEPAAVTSPGIESQARLGAAEPSAPFSPLEETKISRTGNRNSANQLTRSKSASVCTDESCHIDSHEMGQTRGRGEGYVCY